MRNVTNKMMVVDLTFQEGDYEAEFSVLMSEDIMSPGLLHNAVELLERQLIEEKGEHVTIQLKNKSYETILITNTGGLWLKGRLARAEIKPIKPTEA